VGAVNSRKFSDVLFAEVCAPGFRMENTSTAVTDKTYYRPAGVALRT
jgi:hypothetical protein